MLITNIYNRKLNLKEKKFNGRKEDYTLILDLDSFLVFFLPFFTFIKSALIHFNFSKLVCYIFPYVYEACEGGNPGDGADHVVHVGHGREERRQLHSVDKEQIMGFVDMRTNHFLFSW